MANKWYSLAGIEGDRNKGVTLRSASATITAAAMEPVMMNEPMRKWALIQNTGATDVQVFFEDVVTNNAFVLLTPNGILQLDENIPWCGAIWGYLAAGVGELTWIEGRIVA